MTKAELAEFLKTEIERQVRKHGGCIIGEEWHEDEDGKPLGPRLFAVDGSVDIDELAEAVLARLPVRGRYDQVVENMHAEPPRLKYDFAPDPSTDDDWKFGGGPVRLGGQP